jgi:carboxylesterase type B
VWHPGANNPNGFPVMVFVHGGGFVMDSTVKYGDIGIAKYMVCV